jgi:hypothetical protein
MMMLTSLWGLTSGFLAFLTGQARVDALLTAETKAELAKWRCLKDSFLKPGHVSFDVLGENKGGGGRGVGV